MPENLDHRPISRRRALQLLGGASAFTALAWRASGTSLLRGSALELSTSDDRLAAAFAWAKKEALGYVNEGDPVGPWYEAALPGRHAFCMRDTAHQVLGAQALGLARCNHNMLYKFAENIAASRKWCSYWEIDRNNHPASVDYVNDSEFWYNLPANYDVLDACYRMYLWTNDPSYIDNPVFLNFYDRTIFDYTEQWELSPDRIMQRSSNVHPPPYFLGDPTYAEGSTENLVGIDLLSVQYAAFRAYAKIQALRGHSVRSRHASDEARKIKTLINGTWWNPRDDSFYAFYTKQHRLVGRSGADVLYHDAADAGVKTRGAVRTLLLEVAAAPNDAVEPRSHFAEILYRYGHADEAYAQLIALTQPVQPRRDYPEVSYSVIGAIVEGLMGITPELRVEKKAYMGSTAGSIAIRTLGRLTRATEEAVLHNLPFGAARVTVQHLGNRKTVLRNDSAQPLQWRAAFRGRWDAIHVNEKTTITPVISQGPEGIASSAMFSVDPGETIKVAALGHSATETS